MSVPEKVLNCRIRSHFAELIHLIGLVHKFCTKNQVPARASYAAALAVEEIGSNTIKYGSQDHEEIFIHICLSIHLHQIELTIQDNAKPFNPLADAPPPPLFKPQENLRVGGLGCFLVKQLMDEAIYERKNGENLLILRKTMATKEEERKTYGKPQ